MRLLLIEDNPELARATVERLQLDGHAVDHAKDLSSAHDLVAVTRYDLVLLDIMFLLDNVYTQTFRRWIKLLRDVSQSG